MELEAMTNHWFYSKFRKSKRSKKTNAVVSGTEIIRSSFRKPTRYSDGTALAGNSLTEEVKRAIYNNNSPNKSPRHGRAAAHDGETSDTQSMEGAPATKRHENAAFPHDEDKQLLMELIKPRRGPSAGPGPEEHRHHIQVKKVSSNRYQDSDSDSDSAPSSPQMSSRNESMFTHTDSLRSSTRSSSAVSSEGRITIVTDMGGVSDMDIASVDIPYQRAPHEYHDYSHLHRTDPYGQEFSRHSQKAPDRYSPGSRTKSATPANHASVSAHDRASRVPSGENRDPDCSASSDSDSEYTKESLTKIKFKRMSITRSRSPSPEQQYKTKTKETGAASGESAPPDTPEPSPPIKPKLNHTQTHAKHDTSSLKPNIQPSTLHEPLIIDAEPVDVVTDSKHSGDSLPQFSGSSLEPLRRKVGALLAQYGLSEPTPTGGGQPEPKPSPDGLQEPSMPQVNTNTHTSTLSRPDKNDLKLTKKSLHQPKSVPSAQLTSGASSGGSSEQSLTSELSALGPQQRLNPFLRKHERTQHSLKGSGEDDFWSNDAEDEELPAHTDPLKAEIHRKDAQHGRTDSQRPVDAPTLEYQLDSDFTEEDREMALQLLKNNLIAVNFAGNAQSQVQNVREPPSYDSVVPSKPSENQGTSGKELINNNDDPLSFDPATPYSMEYQTYVAAALAAMKKARYGRLFPMADDDDDSLSVISERTEPAESERGDYSSSEGTICEDSDDDLFDLHGIRQEESKQTFMAIANHPKRLSFSFDGSPDKVTVTEVARIDDSPQEKLVSKRSVENNNMKLPYKPYHSAANLPKTFVDKGGDDISLKSQNSETESAQGDGSPTMTVSGKGRLRRITQSDRTESAEDMLQGNHTRANVNAVRKDSVDLDESLASLAQQQSMQVVKTTDLDSSDSEDDLDSLMEANSKYVTDEEMVTILHGTSCNADTRQTLRISPVKQSKVQTASGPEPSKIIMGTKLFQEPDLKSHRAQLRHVETPHLSTTKTISQTHSSPPRIKIDSSELQRTPPRVQMRERPGRSELVDRSPTSSVSSLKNIFDNDPGYMRPSTISTSTPKSDLAPSPQTPVSDTCKSSQPGTKLSKEISPVALSQRFHEEESHESDLSSSDNDQDVPSKSHMNEVFQQEEKNIYSTVQRTSLREPLDSPPDSCNSDSDVPPEVPTKDVNIVMATEIKVDTSTNQLTASTHPEVTDNKIEKIEQANMSPDKQSIPSRYSSTRTHSESVYDEIPDDLVSESSLEQQESPPGENPEEIPRTSSFEELYDEMRLAEEAQKSASVANGHLAPPGNQGNKLGERMGLAAAGRGGASPASSRHSNNSDRAQMTVVPSIAVAKGSPRSQSSRKSGAEAGEDDENIDELFASHASMYSGNESNITKRGSNLLSPFSTSRESIASFYSDAGEVNYGKIPVTGDILFGLDYNYKNNVFEVLIKQCRDLAPVDAKRKRSDPYVKTYLLPDKTKSGKRKTRVKKHTLNPTFEETLRYQITKSELENRTLWLTVWHNDTFGRNDFLGEVTIPMDDYSFNSAAPRWQKLMDRHTDPMSKLAYKGDLVVSLKFVTSDHLISKKRSRAGERGELHVLVKEARNLTAVRANGASDPFCKGYLLPEKTKNAKQKTPVKKRECNPRWNHTFVFEDIALADLSERALELTVWDHDRFTSNDFLGGVRLGIGTGTSGGREVEWMDSLGEEISIWQSMLDRPNCWIEGTLLLRPNMAGRK